MNKCSETPWMTHHVPQAMRSVKPWRSALLLLALSASAPAVELPVKLNDPLVPGGRVQTSTLSPDNRTVVYLAVQDTVGVRELYSVPVDGGPVIKLNAPLVNGGNVFSDFSINANSDTVVYRADQDSNNVEEIYSVPIGGGQVTKLNRPLPSGGGVFDYMLSHDGQWVVYAGEQDTDTVAEIYSVPIGGGTVIKLNGPMTNGGDVSNQTAISPDSSTLVYAADQITDGLFELFSVPISGGTAVRISGPMIANGGIQFDGLRISPDSSTVVYRANQDSVNTKEIYSVPIGGGPVTKLNDPLVSGGNISRHQITPDSARVIYRGDQDINGLDELYSVPLLGGPVTRISNPALGALFNYSINADSGHVVYQISGDRGEIYSVPVLGGVTPTRLNGPLAAGDVVGAFQISNNGRHVLFTTGPQGSDSDPSSNIRGDSPRHNALFSVPIEGGVPLQLTEPYAVGQGLGGASIAPNSGFVFFQDDRDMPGSDRLYGVPIGGGEAVELSGEFVAGGGVNFFKISTDSTRLIYSADQDSAGVDELYSVSSDELLDTDRIFANGFE